jgi:hypothetical protein
LQKFFDDEIDVINKLFKMLKKHKKNIVDSFYFSEKYPKPHPKCKYTDKLYIGCIYFIFKHGSFWESFLGPIPGKQVNKRHHEYIDRYHLYENFFYQERDDYLMNYVNEHNQIKNLMIDTSIINNKNCSEVYKHLPYNKNRKGCKIGLIIEDNRLPLVVSINESTVHDCKIGNQDIDTLINNEKFNEALEKLDTEPFALADSAYDSAELKDKLSNANIKHIIKPNNRGKKYKRKKKIWKRHKPRYKKRIKVEYSFANIKRSPKINCIYERKIKAYFGGLFVLLGALFIKYKINNS